MQIAQVMVENFRGIESGIVTLSGHSVLLGDNNVGKSTLLEAIRLQSTHAFALVALRLPPGESPRAIPAARCLAPLRYRRTG